MDMQSKNISLAARLAALYIGIGAVLPMLAFGPVQCRVADALYPLISVFGWPGVIGLTMGQLIFNSYGLVMNLALGPLDLLSPFVFLPFKILIKKWGYKAVIFHVIAVSLWVPYLIQINYGLPMIATIPGIFMGEAAAELILGGLVLKHLETRLK